MQSTAQEPIVQLKDVTANPAPIGLLAFGLTTVLLNLHNAGFFDINTMVLAMGIFYGGAAQIIAGVMEWKKNNTFGATAFISYGSFWLTLVALLVMPGLGLGTAPVPAAMVAYLLLWGLFTAGMFIASLRINKALQFIFASLTVLYVLLAAADATGSTLIKHVAGYEGIICGLVAVYAGLAQVLNETYHRIVAPLGPAK
jgi:succinate-acetate transporter protein